MFTGIIKEIGTVARIESTGHAERLTVKADTLSRNTATGDSVCVDGVCLTVVAVSQDVLRFDVIRQTLRTTTIGTLKINNKVNLEPSLELKKDASIGGHIVSGHIDEVGTVRRITRFGGDIMQFTIGLNPKAMPFLVQKGSIALNGISLTVSGIERDCFIVNIIPHTYKETTMGLKKPGNKVNLEFDLIGKYVLKNLAGAKAGSVDESFLREHGFL